MKSRNELKKTAQGLIAVLALTVATSCAPEKSANSGVASDLMAQNIIGGVDSSLDYQKLNGIVGLLLVSETPQGQQQSSICTGSLISTNVVLTAAHCLVIDPGTKLVAALVFFERDLDVVMNQISQGNYSNVKGITKIARHKEYLKSKTSHNDIGLLKFDGAAPQGFRVAKMAAVQTISKLTKQSTVTLAGFGASKYEVTEEGETNSEGSGLLRQVSGIAFLGFSPSGEEMVFDQKQGKGACHGDSGGPAYFVDPVTRENLLVGVTSRGTEERGMCDQEAIYTSVMAHTQWIADNLKQLQQNDAPVVAATERQKPGRKVPRLK